MYERTKKTCPAILPGGSFKYGGRGKVGPIPDRNLASPLTITISVELRSAWSYVTSSRYSILALARNYIYYISKETFFLAFKAAYNLTFTKKNACVGFRGARLVLFNLEAVLIKLNVKLRTLTLL